MTLNIANAPELDWLKANSINGTPEGVDTVDKEFKRTWCSIELFNAVVNNNYEAFSTCQPESSRISRESFGEICSYVNSVLTTDDDKNAMRAFLVINDLGKVSDFVQKIADTLNFNSVDHDKILFEGLKSQPELSPTFLSLERKYQNIILTGLKTSFNMGQYVQCESLPANLIPLTTIDETSLNYYMIHFLFDISGAAGHVVPNGSIICNELYWKKFSWALNSILDMTHGLISPVEAYNQYVAKTKHYYKVNSDVIAKLCNLIRISNTKEAEEIISAFKSLDTYVQKNLEKELTKTGIEDSAILMYYAPATFQNAYTYYKNKNPEVALSETIKKIAPLLSILFKSIREKMVCSDNGITIAFIADIATMAKDPEKLNDSFCIKQVGKDFKFIANKTSK